MTLLSVLAQVSLGIEYKINIEAFEEHLVADGSSPQDEPTELTRISFRRLK